MRRYFASAASLRLVALLAALELACGTTRDVAFTEMAATPPPEVPSEGLVLWLRADQGIQVSPIGLWRNQVSAASDAIQDDVDRRPELVPDAWEGKPVVRFSRATELELPDLDLSQGLTAVFVMRELERGVGAYFRLSEPDDLRLVAESSRIQLQPMIVARPPLGRPFLLGLRLDPQVGGELLLDGIVPSSAELEFTQGVHSGVRLGAGAQDVAEVVIYSRPLRGTEWDALQGALAERWGCCAL